MKKYLVILVSFVVFTAHAQTIQVPKNVYFADIHLNIEESAQKIIQTKVDYLLKYPTYFQQKVDRADTYFPIIERVFKETGVPDDFKYLAVQESGLVSDAISKSNAVGFWQFKMEAASDFGLKVNQQVDERRHIIEASRSAAQYFLKSNIYYKNWCNSLVSYYMGFTGAKAYARPSDAGSKNMSVSNKTHEYLLTFIAHKIAFENFVGKNPAPAVTLREMRANPGQTLGEIALAIQADPVEIEKYNKWLLNGAVPSDKAYTVIIPVTNATASIAANVPQTSPAVIAAEQVKTAAVSLKNAEQGTLNGLKVIYARPRDTKDKLALQAKISTKKFLKFNDMYGFEQIEPGKPYYIERKKKEADVEKHIALQNETLFSIAQQYGMQLKQILRKNRMKKNENLIAGRVLWLQETRPAKVAVEYQNVEVPESPKTPAPLVAEKTEKPAKEVVMETSVASTEADIKTETPAVIDVKKVKESTAAVFRRAGKALKVQPEPTKVATVGTEPMEVYENTTEPVIVEEIAPVAVSEPVTAASSAEPVQAVNQSEAFKTQPNATQPETIIVEEVKNENQQVIEIKEAPKTLYPVTEKTVAIAETTAPAPAEEYQKVVLREPVSNKTENAAADFYVATSHKVAKGETLYAIARKYSLSPADLKTWNKLGEKPLAIGQELTLKAPVQEKKVVAGSAAAKAVLVINEPVTQTTAEPETAITAENTASPSVVTHKVGAGESMYQISRKYGVSIKEIMEWNSKSDFNVSAGEELIVKAKPANSRN